MNCGDLSGDLGKFSRDPLTPRNLAEPEPAAKKETYRPPGSTTDFAEKFRQARKNQELKPAAQPKKAPPPPPQDYIPGMDPEMMPKKKKKKKKKKELFEGN